LMNSDIEFITDSERIRPKNSEVFRLVCDNTKIIKATGFESKINLKEGLKRTIDWILKPDNLKQYKSDIYNV